MDGEWPPMELFRSEEMKLVQLIMPAESAHETVMYLGDLGLLQFKDLNPDKSPFQRTYANQVKRCGEMARRLHFLRDQIDKAGISIGSRPTRRGDVDLDELEGKLAELEGELLEINANCERLERTHSELTEFKLVLQKSGIFFSLKQSKMGSDQRELNDLSTADEESVDRPFLLEQQMPTEPSKQARLGFITGVVAKAKAAPFELVLHRATRGNMYFKQADIEGPLKDPATGEKIDKVVFIVFFSGDWARTKVLKLCEAFGASRYPFPEEVGMQAQMMSEVSDRLRELQTTIDASFRHRDAVLTTVGCEIDQWELIVLREKAVYYTLNMFSVDVTRKCLVAEGWCPQSAKTQIQDALQRAAFDCNSQVATIFQVVETQELPPTYFKTNKFTRPFQEIVDAYGVARYQEANPGVYTIVTFPFLFAVMFGDWGHGIVMLVAVLWLIFNEKRYRNQKLGDIMGMAFGGRYVILLMSVFSIYTGLIYNEFFSVPFSIFGSSAYHCSDVNCSTAHKNGLNKTSSYTYPFGVDPSWHGTRTELPFLNSLKMKMSILIGVAQMNLGIILSYYNGKFFQNQLNIWYQFIPQIIFLNALFGYLCFLILVKWCFGSKADLYHVMIYMFLSPTDDLGENQLFWGQKFFQIILLLMAIVAVPWMLFPKPLILRRQHLKRLQGRMYGVLEASDTDSLEVDSEASLSYEFEFSEVFVHQMIHTIEFVLGAVSNTASYLRLWALSLAHAELSAVFYEKVLILSWRYNSIFIRTLGVSIFICATVGVLLLMETLSAFLHALRLHWVELQSKFYEGDGYKFQPFSFSTLRGQDD